MALKVSIEDLQIGDRTGSDVFNQTGLLIVSAHTVLNEDDIEKLYRHHIDYIDIMIRYNGQLDSTASSPAPSSQLSTKDEAFKDAIGGIKQLFEQILDSGNIQEEQVEQSFVPLAKQFEQEKDVVSLLLTLNSKDDYTYQHSVQVGMISYYIAKWLGQTEEEALFAGKAGYLHDIGKGRLSEALLLKPGKLTEEEFSLVKEHTRFGYELIKSSGFDEALAIAALQHHERCDGTGYPNQISAKDIHPLAKIVAVADVYSAMTTHRVYQEKQDLLRVLKELHQMSFGKLDPHITQVFIRNMIPNFIGKKVLLSSGETGSIVLTHPTDFFHPLVQVDQRFINLSETMGLEIQEVYM